MKPDWKDAPEWAQWLAADSDGNWWWYELEPEQSGGAFIVFDGRLKRHCGDANWKCSKEQRP